jgi:hypothetical protein
VGQKEEYLKAQKLRDRHQGKEAEDLSTHQEGLDPESQQRVGHPDLRVLVEDLSTKEVPNLGDLARSPPDQGVPRREAVQKPRGLPQM